MNYRLYISCISAILLVACSQGDEGLADAGAVKICFSGSASRGASARAIEDMPTTYAMWVNALYHDGEKHNFYFSSQEEKEFSYNGLWSGRDQDYYYPYSGTMDFVAYALSDRDLHPQAVYSSEDDKSAFTGIALDFGTTLDGTADVLCSERISGVECPYVTALPMNFVHALARLTFNLESKDQETIDRLHIQSLTVHDANISGKLQVTYTNANRPVCSWTPRLTSDLAISDLPPFTEENPVSCSLNIVPQSQATSFTLTYTIDNGNGTDSPFYTTPTLTYTASFPTIAWEQGKEYTYNIACTLNEFIIEEASVAYWKIEIDALASLKDWEDGGSITETPGMTE